MIYSQEMATGNQVRFPFGKNWSDFLSVIDENRISQATARLRETLGDIKGKTFLDAGCGSGLHSLAAVRLGASRVYSFDYDLQSVECTKEMKRRFAPDANWQIERGSVLDDAYMAALGKFDILYSWGVLHHTGNMWKALDLAATPAKEKLMIAIYNDQGWKSMFWQSFKRSYNRRSRFMQRPMEWLVFAWAWGKPFVLHPRVTIERWRNYANSRGMSPWYDVVDWAGGYPFEVATPAQLIGFYEKRGFVLDRTHVHGGSACNEFVFKRI